MELDKILDKYNQLLNLLQQIDYSDYQKTYDTSIRISKYNWELALQIMINIVVETPKYFNETIRDSIFLSVQNEGNRNTYKYIIELLNRQIDEDVMSYLTDMKGSIEEKYIQLNIKLL